MSKYLHTFNTVKCHFCGKACRLFNDDVIKFSSWQCDYHGAVRVRKLELLNDAFNITLVILHKDNRYDMTFYHNQDQDIKFTIVEVQRWPKTHKMIMTLDFHPPITPENAEQKLPTMILFS